MPTYTDVQMCYTKQVADFLSKGYYISSSTNSGRYDRCASVDLIHPDRPNEMYRVRTNYFRDYIFFNEYCFSIETVKYTVSKYLDVNDPTTVGVKKFYSINSLKNPYLQSCFFVDSEDLESVITKRKSRRDNKPYNRDVEVHDYKLNKFSNRFIDSIMEKINKVRGFKNATAACVDNVKVTHSFCKQNSYAYSIRVNFSYKDKNSSIYMTQYRCR